MRLTLHSIQVAKVGWVLAGIGSLLAVADAKAESEGAAV
jgi:hypothetical protein